MGVRLNEKTLKEIADEAASVAERAAISEALRATKGNKSQAARALETDYKTLHLKIKKFGIRWQDFRS
jgi:two-component system nitrogen regulation response regulator GlnG